MVRGAKAAGAVMTDCRSSFFIMPDGFLDMDLARIEFDKVSMHEGVVRLPNGSADLRYRPLYESWRIHLEIQFNALQIQIPQLVNLCRLAGFGVGLCEWRPECGGTFGRFTVGKVEDMGTVSL